MVISSSAIKATANADALIILTEWEEFRIISPQDIASSMASKQVIDARNLLDRTDWKNSGFFYQGIGS
jgi:UDPglucose 6-dehydrogenase